MNISCCSCCCNIPQLNTPKPLPQDALQPQKNLRYCCAIKFAPCGMCNRTQKSQPTGTEQILFLWVESTVWHSLTNQSRGEEVEQKKSKWRIYPFKFWDSTCSLIASMRVVGSKLLSPRYPRWHRIYHFLCCWHTSSQDQDKIAAFPTAAVAKHRVAVAWGSPNMCTHTRTCTNAGTLDHRVTALCGGQMYFFKDVHVHPCMCYTHTHTLTE